MRILVIGGTEFVGRHFVARALEDGHQLTLFNRGRTNPTLFPEAERIRGDRDGGLAPLAGRTWDVAVDTCGYLPRLVGSSARLLAGAVEHLTFVSTLSVHPDDVAIGAREDAPISDPPPADEERITDETYGPLKVACEREVQAAFPGRALIVRPGLIVGPYDPTDRFTYWVRRVAEGGEVLAPAPASYQVQFIDVRDLASFMLAHAEARTAGVFSAVAPPVSLGQVLEASQGAAGSDAVIAWLPESFLRSHDVAPWTDLPMWMPEFPGFNAFDPAAAIAVGLFPRSVGETVADTLAWDRTRPQTWPMRAGLDRERERELLRLSHASQA
ncbi:MAG: NAD-dependent epimerase/dehydratase family protein [Actinomycetota bacterium]